jgi:hypothetical protein
MAAEKAGFSMKKDALEKQYRDITSLYDMAEELADTVESEFVRNPDDQLALIEPLITQVADSADILSEEYVQLLEKPSRKKAAKGRIESALRKIFTAVEEYRERAGTQGKKTLAALANIADPIVDKIHKQVRKITIVFMHFVELSLERIMHKFEIEEFKRTNGKIMSQLLQVGH